MENASKALIIAGAILISILLISIGIILVNSGRSITDTGASQMTAQEIQTFNAQFTTYEGISKGSEIRGLWNAVNSSNGIYEDHQVFIDPDNMNIFPLNPRKDYQVDLFYGTDGYVSEIYVTEL